MIGCERKISVLQVSHAYIKSHCFVLQNNNMIGRERKVNGLGMPHAIIESKFRATKQSKVILRGRAGYELIYITHEAVGRVGYYQLISDKSEKNNCFSKFSSNSLDFFG